MSTLSRSLALGSARREERGRRTPVWWRHATNIAEAEGSYTNEEVGTTPQRRVGLEELEVKKEKAAERKEAGTRDDRRIGEVESAGTLLLLRAVLSDVSGAYVVHYASNFRRAPRAP